MTRSIWKGPFVDRHLLKKVEQHREGVIKGGWYYIRRSQRKQICSCIGYGQYDWSQNG